MKLVIINMSDTGYKINEQKLILKAEEAEMRTYYWRQRQVPQGAVFPPDKMVHWPVCL